MAPLVSEIAHRFEQTHPGVRIDVQSGGSSQGIADVRRGTTDIGMSSRALTSTERAAVTSHLLAHDGVAMLVHADNLVTNLTDQQVRQLYTGQVRKWSELGGRDAPVTVINRAEGRAELLIISEYLDVTPAAMRASLISGENQHGIKSVAGDPHAIVYMSVGASEYAITQGEPVKLLRWNDVSPSSASVAAGVFPVSRPLILVTATQPSPLVEALLAYACSATVNDLIEAFFYVPPQR